MVTRGPYRKRDEVVEQILQAAEELLAERGPSEVTVRDVAERAGVQHSLVHRHFTSKENLVTEVVRRTLAAYTDAIAEVEDPAEAFVAGMIYMAEHRPSFAAMTRALMAADPSAVDPSAVDLFPGFETHMGRLAPGSGTGRGRRARLEKDGPIDPRVLTVALMAFTSGWAFLEDWWMAAGGFRPRDRHAVRAQVASLLRRTVERELPTRDSGQ